MAIRFLTFELDVDQRELRDQGKPLSMPPSAFNILCYLVQHRDRMVSKSELLDAFWSSNVSEAALQKAISRLRKALRDNDHDLPMIKTYHGLGFRFAPEVEALTASSGPPLAAKPAPQLALREQRVVAMLCVRLCAPENSGEGSGLAETAVEEFLISARSIVRDHQGSLVRITRHGFIADFGLSQHCEDGARRAVYCAVALCEDAKNSANLTSSIELACGIDAGLVSSTKSREAEEWVLPGAVERQATDLAECAQGGEVLLSGTSQGQLGDEVQTAPVSHGYLLKSIEGMRAGIPGRPLRRPASFVGRSAEMAFLAQHIDELRSGNGKAVLLSGPAGIGKTRLVSEFLASLDGTAQRQIKLQCLPALSNSPTAVIRELCLSLISDVRGKIVEDETDAALLGELLDDRSATKTAVQTLSDHQRRQRSYELIERMLTAVCEDQPLILVFEDVHWVDATSRDYLDAIIQNAGSKQLLIVMTSRPTDDPALSEAVLQLSPLSQQDSLRVLAESFDQTPVHKEMANTLVQRAAGNPFFIEELALAARTGGDPVSDLPDTVQAVIAVRIGALSSELRSLLFVVAVIGPPASAELAGHLLGQPADVIEQQLEQLVRTGFVQADPLGYSFRHMLIHDAAYAMVVPRERVRLHKDIATYLESDAPKRKPRPETLAWHFQESGNAEKAISYWKAASRDALHKQSLREAVVFARNGLALIGPQTPEAVQNELELQLYLAPALTTLRGYGAEDVGEAYYRARELSAKAGTPKTEIRVLVGLWIHTWVRGRLAESMEHARSLLDLSEQIKDPALSLQAHASAGQVLLHMGQFESALDNLKLGLAAIGDAPPNTVPAQNSAVACTAYVCWANSLLGNRRAALEAFSRSSSLSKVLENPFAEAIHNALCSEPFMFLGDVERCLDCADRAIAVSREHDFVFWLGTGLVMRGWAKGQLGEFEAAFEAIDEGISVFEGAGAGVQLANWYGLKAETLLTAGKLENGIEAAKHALVCGERTADLFFVPRIHATMARLYEQMGESERAEDHQQRAAAMAEKFGMTNDLIGKPSQN